MSTWGRDKSRRAPPHPEEATQRRKKPPHPWNLPGRAARPEQQPPASVHTACPRGAGTWEITAAALRTAARNRGCLRVMGLSQAVVLSPASANPGLQRPPPILPRGPSCPETHRVGGKRCRESPGQTLPHLPESSSEVGQRPGPRGARKAACIPCECVRGRGSVQAGAGGGAPKEGRARNREPVPRCSGHGPWVHPRLHCPGLPGGTDSRCHVSPKAWLRTAQW